MLRIFCSTVLYYLMMTLHPLQAQVSFEIPKYRCWVYSKNNTKPVKGFLLELGDSSIVVATNYKRPKTIDEIELKEFQVTEIQKIALQKTSRRLEAALFLGGSVVLLATIGLINQHDDLFSKPGVAIGFGAVFGLPFGVLGGMTGGPKKAYSFDGDFNRYHEQRDLMKKKKGSNY